MHHFRAFDLYVILVAITALISIVQAIPLSGAPSLEGPEIASTFEVDAEYFAAWKEATGTVPSNLVSKLADSVDSAPLPARSVGPWFGQNSYTAFAFHNNRYCVSLVMVSNTAGGLGDGATNTAEVASNVALNARQIIGNSQGLWSSTSWGFYGNPINGPGGPGFTIVAKNILPPDTSYSRARLAAVVLAQAYGFSTDVAFPLYPKNSNKRGEQLQESAEFTMLADFKPTDKLVELLVQRFHYQEFGMRNATAAGRSEGTEALGRRGVCNDFNEKNRAKRDWAPVNTGFDYGCVGRLSDFGAD